MSVNNREVLCCAELLLDEYALKYYQSRKWNDAKEIHECRDILHGNMCTLSSILGKYINYTSDKPVFTPMGLY